MHHITLGSENDFDGWRKAARTLARHEVEPSAVTWSVRSNAPELFEPSARATPLEASHDTFSGSAKFVEPAQAPTLPPDPPRLPIPYRLLWRLRPPPPPP